MVATSLDSREKLQTKYHFSSEANLKELETMGCLLVHEVDVHDMGTHPILKNMKFDRIVFNFPHAGHTAGLHETMSYVIELHKELLLAFFKSAKEMLNEVGQVHVTHRDDLPYSKWEITELAKRAGLALKEKVLFWPWDYPGYCNRRGSNIRGGESFPFGSSYTFKFAVRAVEDDDEMLSDGLG